MTHRHVQLAVYTILPLAGILLLHWDWRQVIILYWLENVTVGIMTLITIFNTTGSASLEDGEKPALSLNGKPVQVSSRAAKYVYAGFFAIHYGMFTFVHGIFVLLLVGGMFTGGSSTALSTVSALSLILALWVIVTVVQALITWRRTKELQVPQQSLAKSFAAPYKRIIALHFTIILGVFAIVILKLPSAAAILLILIHAVINWRSYRRTAATPKILN